MKLYDEGNKLTKEDIVKYEMELNIKFPEDYINFLLESNGGTPEEDLVFDFIDVVNNETNSTDIREFYIFYEENEDMYDDIMEVNSIMREEETISEDYFVIADDSAGNPICMKINGDDKGTIFFGDHELEDADTGYILMSKVADSFSEFIGKLYILD